MYPNFKKYSKFKDYKTTTSGTTALNRGNRPAYHTRSLPIHGVSNSDPLNQTIMQVQDYKKLLNHAFDAGMRYSIDLDNDGNYIDFEKWFNSLSEFERQTVSNNEQTENKCDVCGSENTIVAPHMGGNCLDCNPI